MIRPIKYCVLFIIIVSIGKGQCDSNEVELWNECYGLNSIHLVREGEGLTGEIPPEIGLLTKLRQLRLGYNQLSGPIPPEIGNLDSVWWFNLSSNNLSGSIPPELWDLESLKQLFLMNNQFTGSIPAGIGNLTKLTHMYLYNNQFEGPLPDDIGNLSRLFKLNLSHNQLTGPLPESICNLDVEWRNRNTFRIANNNFCPPYPDCISDNMNYQNCDSCESNYAFDGFCAEQSDLDVLQLFIDNSTETINMYMDDNQNGVVDPIELGEQEWNSGRLSELNCYYDHTFPETFTDLGLSGLIPSEIGNLDSLEMLWLEENALTGPIPPEIGNLQKLIYLILNHNQLSGSIPDEMGNLSSLQILKINNNQLTGMIPDSLCNLDIVWNWGNHLFGENFAVYNNQLCPPYPDCLAPFVGLQYTANCDPLSIFNNVLPDIFRLSDPYPNPFNPVTTLDYYLPEDAIINISVYDMKGHKVKDLSNGFQDAGFNSVEWSGFNNAGAQVSSGIYLFIVQMGPITQTRKMVLMK